jgi:hypothetical protein
VKAKMWRMVEEEWVEERIRYPRSGWCPQLMGNFPKNRPSFVKIILKILEIEEIFSKLYEIKANT